MTFKKYKLIIIGVIVILVGLVFVTIIGVQTKGSKECVIDSDCVSWGRGECNCGCYNKEYLPKRIGGAGCFCAPPPACECRSNRCEGTSNIK